MRGAPGMKPRRSLGVSICISAPAPAICVFLAALFPYLRTTTTYSRKGDTGTALIIIYLSSSYHFSDGGICFRGAFYRVRDVGNRHTCSSLTTGERQSHPNPVRYTALFSACRTCKTLLVVVHSAAVGGRFTFAIVKRCYVHFKRYTISPGTHWCSCWIGRYW